MAHGEVQLSSQFSHDKVNLEQKLTSHILPTVKTTKTGDLQKLISAIQTYILNKIFSKNSKRPYSFHIQKLVMKLLQFLNFQLLKEPGFKLEKHQQNEP